VIKGCKIVVGQKLANTCSFVCGRIIVQQEKNSRAERSLDEAVECASGGDSLFLYKFCIYCFSFWYEFSVHCALRVEKIIDMVLMRDLWNFSFFGRGDVSPTQSEICRFVSGS
jgi:hypothetical protein